MLAARATEAAIWDWNAATGVAVWSEGMDRVFGYAVADTTMSFGWWSERIHPEDRARVVTSLESLLQTPNPGSAWQATYRFLCFDGHYATVVDRGYVACDATGKVVRLVGAMEDDTERETLSERLRQAQKMEAVGQLAGGVAHDFNNLLTVIVANLEFARTALGEKHPALPDLEEIAAAAQRARELVRQLLLFSRHQPIAPVPLNLSAVVEEAETLLRRVIGEEIVLDVHLADDLPPIRADKSQMEQILLNLAVNARDAMLTPALGTPGKGGLMQIETAHVVLGAADVVRLPGSSVGSAVRLRVRDTGHGMDEATQQHVFEPFFTTKDVGAGTGLGLATVFGIVQQAGGMIHLETSPGMGTVFSLYFPTIASPDEGGGTPAESAAVAAEPSAKLPEIPPSPAPEVATAAALAASRDGAARAASPTSTAPATSDSPAAIPEPPAVSETTPAPRVTVLLVEDEAPVRTALRRMLERNGFQVLEARHGADALLLWNTTPGGIDAIITDVRMPEMGGPELVRIIRRASPHVPVVFMSGYSKEELRNGEDPQTAFISKPFSRDQLIEAIRMVMVPPPVAT
jgi:signal transduction histidine kinase